MDLQPDKTPGLGLPQPSVEQSAASFGVFEGGHHGREVRPITMESPLPVQPQTTAAIPAAQPVAQQPIPIALAPDPGANSTMGSASATADDNTDALDEEWVSKAKAIVERTKSDPYLETKELNKAKADYLRVRYNKELKVSEESH
jgi:hypothetical protein